jgi:hypothetical protein
VLAGLQESLARDQKQAADNTALQRNALHQRLAAVRNRMDRAYQDKLDAKISEDFWERRAREWSEDEQRIQEALARLEQPAPQRLLTAQRTFRTREQGLFFVPYPHSSRTGPTVAIGAFELRRRRRKCPSHLQDAL